MMNGHNQTTIPDGLDGLGLDEYPNIMRNAIQNGTIDSLTLKLSDPKYWDLFNLRRNFIR